MEASDQKLELLGRIKENFTALNLQRNSGERYPKSHKRLIFEALAAGIETSEIMLASKIDDTTLYRWSRRFKKKENAAAPKVRQLKLVDDSPKRSTSKGGDNNFFFWN